MVWVTNMNLCLYTEFLNSRNQFFFFGFKCQSFSVLYLDIVESSYDLCVRVLIRSFQWLYFNCQLPVYQVSTVCLPLIALCQFFFPLCAHGFVCSAVTSGCGVLVAGTAVSALWGRHWANWQISAVKAQKKGLSLCLCVSPAVRKSSPNSQTRSSSAPECSAPAWSSRTPECVS